METPTPETAVSDYPSTVDASRPFHSVKEAVAIFGERLFLKEIQSTLKLSPSSATEKDALRSYEFTPNSEKQPELAVKNGASDSSDSYEFTPSPEIANNDNNVYPCSSFSWELGVSPPVPSISTISMDETTTPSFQNLKNDKPEKIVHGNDLVMMLMILKRLEGELQETKMEVKLLKERESETEVALASLNAELHKMAQVEVVEASKAAVKAVTLVDQRNKETETGDEDRRKCEMVIKHVDSPTLAQILSITDYDSYFGDYKKVKKSMKKKPIIPLVTDFLSWRKR